MQVSPEPKETGVGRECAPVITPCHAVPRQLALSAASVITPQPVRCIATTDSYRLYCVPASYRLFWLGILVFHFLNFSAQFGASIIYLRTLQDPQDTYLLLRNAGVTFDTKVALSTGLAGACFAACHLFHIVRALWFSVRYRRLVLQEDDSDGSSTISVLTSASKLAPKKAIEAMNRCGKFLAFISPLRCVWRVFSVCGVRGKYFDQVFYLRELIEIGLQTYQASRISLLIPQAWISHVAVFVLVLNCVTTPVLYVLYANNVPMRRVLCLGTDIALDFISSMGFPYLFYASSIAHSKLADWYNPLWVIEAGNQGVLIVLTTWLDLASRVIPTIGMLLCLSSIQRLLHSRPRTTVVMACPPQNQTQTQNQSQNSPSKDATAAHKERDGASFSALGLGQSSPLVEESPDQGRGAQKRVGEGWSKPLHGIFAVYAVAVAVVYGLAYQQVANSQLPGCQLKTHAWLSTKHPCAVLELNCHQQKLIGTTAELTEQLRLADWQTLSALIISHCPQLEIPPAIRDFPNLIWFEIYNSTIISWGQHAALVASWTPRLSRLLITSTNMTEYPRGLLGDAAYAGFPPKLVDIAFVDTNLTTLPPQLGLVLPVEMVVLLFERCQLRHLPEALATVHTDTFSLAGNALTQFPAFLLSQHSYSMLSLAQNPLTSLPDLTVVSKWYTSILYLDGTQVAELPELLLHGSSQIKIDVVSATGTPLCLGGINRTMSARVSTAVACSTPKTSSVLDGALFPTLRHAAMHMP